MKTLLTVIVLVAINVMCVSFVPSPAMKAHLLLRRNDITHVAATTTDETAETDSLLSGTFRAPDFEIFRRRNFAIISHPDAGKTTLTEKLLLFGGAIQDAGAVKARADQRKATSDWMEIEKARGISVTSTVLSFEYTKTQMKTEDNTRFHLNLLDTPGHQDFSEDTYRTLAAADNCVMLIDAAKGIEDRTRKLFEVCKMRKLPIFTFTNKVGSSKSFHSHTSCHSLTTTAHSLTLSSIATCNAPSIIPY